MARIFGTISLALLAIVIVGLLSEGYVKQKVPVSLYGYQVFVDLWNKGYVGLRGTWVMENDRPAFPLQASEINCLSSSQECIESRAEISDDMLLINQDTYEITHWDEHILIYTQSAQCVDYVYTVNRDTEQVSGIRKLKKGMEKACPETSKELKLRLTNGFDVYWKMQQDARPVAATIAAFVVILILAGFNIRRIVKSPRPVS